MPGQMAAILQTTFSIFFLDGNLWISINISMNFVPKGQINNIQAFVSDNGLAQTRRQAIIRSTGG